MKRVIYTSVDQFLRDDDFIRYTLDASPDKDSYWASYLNAAPQIKTAYLKAYDILTHLDDCEILSQEEVQRLKQRIKQTIQMSLS